MRLFYFAAPLLATAVAAAQPVAGTNPATMAVRPGSWTYAAMPTGGEASFVDSSGTAQLVLRCVRANRSIVLSIRGAPVTSMLVWTSSTSRSLPASYDPASSRITASLSASDQLLDAIVFSRGRFSASVAGLSPLVVPAWPEPARAVEDCRN